MNFWLSTRAVLSHSPWPRMWPVSSEDVGGPNGNSSAGQIDVRFYRFCTEKKKKKELSQWIFFFKCLGVGMVRCRLNWGKKCVFIPGFALLKT